MPFRKFEKIHRLGKEEVEGILEGTVIIQEKIDGANTSIWMDNGESQFGSRNRHLIDDDFNGFVSYAKQHEGIQSLLEECPQYHLYGEWLVPHTVKYKEDAYKKWYLYDIWDTEFEYYLNPHEVKYEAVSWGLEMPWVMASIENPIIEQLKDFVGQSRLGDRGEGIVIKNLDFKNRWGQTCYAKLVTDTFMEQNALVFGGNNKHAENYNELYVINKWLTKARIEKIANKLAPEIDEKLDLKHIPRIINTAYHDLITEEAWEIAKLNKAIDYSKLKTLALKKAKLHYMELINAV